MIGVIGSEDAYLTLLRGLAAVNLNSRSIISVRLGKFIDDVSDEQLEDVDALVLYSYNYRNQSAVWDKLERYVESGGKVFIETGSDVKETDIVSSSNYKEELPFIFPIQATKKESLGTQWELYAGDTSELENINLEDFGSPVIDDEPWMFSIPRGEEDIREGAKALLSTSAVPLVVAWSYGEGKVVWSGMNLPFHIAVHKSMEEAKFFSNIMNDFVDTTQVKYGDFNMERQSANRVVIQGVDAKGAILREHSYPGWSAKLKANGISRKLKIYGAGPTYYGFSYVRIPKEVQVPFTITFSYRGEFWVYFWQFIWFLVVFLVLDRVIFRGRFIVPVVDRLVRPIRKIVGGWWEKDED